MARNIEKDISSVFADIQRAQEKMEQSNEKIDCDLDSINIYTRKKLDNKLNMQLKEVDAYNEITGKETLFEGKTFQTNNTEGREAFKTNYCKSIFQERYGIEAQLISLENELRKSDNAKLTAGYAMQAAIAKSGLLAELLKGENITKEAKVIQAKMKHEKEMQKSIKEDVVKELTVFRDVIKEELEKTKLTMKEDLKIYYEAVIKLETKIDNELDRVHHRIDIECLGKSDL